MKLFGHPVHVMLVHFPSALFPLDLICSVLWYYTGSTPLGYGAFFAMIGGVAGGWLAAAFGLLDLLGIPAAKKASQAKALTHGTISAVLLLGYTVVAYRHFRAYPDLLLPSVPLLLTKGGLNALLLLGDYFGGDLVYRHGIGLDRQQPETASS